MKNILQTFSIFLSILAMFFMVLSIITICLDYFSIFEWLMVAALVTLFIAAIIFIVTELFISDEDEDHEEESEEKC